MFLFFFLFAAMMAAPVLWPQADLFASHLFFNAGQGFVLANHGLFIFLHKFAVVGPRILAVLLALLALWAWRRHDKARFSAKSGVFLLLVLLIGPGLVANVGFKDHWGRSRPREIVDFGGTAAFSSALTPQFHKARSNGSFVSGDGAFGFFLPSFAYVAPRRLSRRVFWAGMMGGAVFGFVRLAMGAHFLSDVIYAGFFMLLTGACIHAAMFGIAATKEKWRLWLGAGDHFNETVRHS